MSERRSGRSRKNINYARFGENGDDEDDDFQVIKSPSEKRQRTDESKKEKKKKKRTNDKASSSQSSTSSESQISQEIPAKPNKRLSVDEKIFERQLKVVLERSASEAYVASQNVTENGDDDDDFRSCSTTSKKKKKELSFEEKSDEVRKSALVSSSSENEDKNVEKSGCDDVVDDEKCEVQANDDHRVEDDVAKPAFVTKSSETEALPDLQPPEPVISNTSPRKNVKRSQPLVIVTDKTDIKKRGSDLSLISPVKKCSLNLLPSKGLRLGLSRKVSTKSLHPEARLVS